MGGICLLVTTLNQLIINLHSLTVENNMVSVILNQKIKIDLRIVTGVEGAISDT